MYGGMYIAESIFICMYFYTQVYVHIYSMYIEIYEIHVILSQSAFSTYVGDHTSTHMYVHMYVYISA